MRSSDDDLLAANGQFYAAFAAGDFVAMEALWAERETVTCLHPGWTGLQGRDAVLASWRGILRQPSGVVVRDEIAVMLGEEAGMVVCTEALGEVELAATNVFVREAGEWRMLHHHAGLIARRGEDDDDEDEPEDEQLLN